jgi:hypothetical protein
MTLHFSLLPASPGVGFNVNFVEEECALLYLPQGASREDLLNVKKLMSVAERQAPQWYDFARKLGRNGPLFVVTGCDKTHIWGMMSFSGASRSAGLSAKISVAGVIDGKISWDFTKNDYRSCDFRTGPTPPSPVRNQCVFLRGIELREPEKAISKWIEKATGRIKVPKQLGRGGLPFPFTLDRRVQPDPESLNRSGAARDSNPCDVAQVTTASILRGGSYTEVSLDSPSLPRTMARTLSFLTDTTSPLANMHMRV